MESKTLLGIDFGNTNIGLALGKEGLTMPLHTVNAKDTNNAIKEISRIALENKVGKVIVGLPLAADGKETQQSLNTRKFTKMMNAVLKLPQEFINENASSKEALEGAITGGVSQKNRRSVDNISAAIILKRYYEDNAK